MTLVKTSLLSLIATFFKMLSGLVINKAVSIYIGPTGLAAIGQFQNFCQLALVAAQGAINNGIVKYTAEYENDSSKLKSLLRTSLQISVISTIIVSFILIIFSSIISQKILFNINFQYIIIIFSLSIILFVINGLLLSVLNGLGKIRYYIQINIIQSIYSLVFTGILIIFFGLKGALIALATNQSFICIITIFIIKKNKIVNWEMFQAKFDKNIARKLLFYSLMAIFSAISMPIASIIIRNYISSHCGTQQAGYWQGLWYISTMYLLVITTALSTYFLPKLSKAQSKIEIKTEIIAGYKLLLPIAIISALIIFTLKKFIVFFLFSQDFIPMIDLFTWQLIGDILKISSWLLSYIILAKAMAKAFIISEISFCCIFTLSSMKFISLFGIIGVTYSYAFSYFIYLFGIFFFVKMKSLI